MKLEWLGKNRALIEAMFRWSNSYAAIYRKPFPVTKDISLSFSEIQVVEYLLENEELQLNMAAVARRLGISPSAFTGHVAKLEKLGLLQKFFREGNRKDMIVLVTEQGRTMYDSYSRQLHALWQTTVLEKLDAIPDEYCQAFTQIIDGLHAAPKEKRGGQFRPLTPVKKDEP